MRRGVNLANSVHNTRGGAIKCAEVEDTPYGRECGKCGALRVDNQIGLEDTPADYLSKMVAVFREVRRVLRHDGTCWVNMGDSYSNDTKWGGTSGGKNYTPALGGYTGQRVRRGKDCDPKRGEAAIGQPMQNTVGPFKPKDLVGMPWRLAFALQDDGWWLRQDIIWHKPNPMPESVQDRCTKAHEYLFLLAKSEIYYFDNEAIKEKVSGTANSRGSGVNPKAGGETGVGFGHGYDAVEKPRYKATGRNSRQNVDRDPEHLGRLLPKQNSSFSGSVNELVSMRNKRSVWTIATQSFEEAHFATFPESLVEPCILAGTSEKGCCEKCGAPWERVMSEATGGMKGQSYHDHSNDLANGAQSNHGATVFATYRAGETVGWEPTCECGAGVVTATVMDPFMGSGTTGIVALENRCNFIGIELNPEYAAMAERRLSPLVAQGVLV